MEPVIGLEIHAQLNTKTKLFCSCPTDFGAEPNSHVCPICTGQPGALPRINQEALKLATRAGLALGCEVQEYSLFSRKNYFYPDLPNGFQTSQLDPPICIGGQLEVEDARGQTVSVRLNRIHLEDDAGKCIHDERRDKTMVDLNRAGVPLIEIVTEPDLSSGPMAVEFLKKLHNLLVRLGVTMGRMEEGEFRCDVNISLKPVGASELGVRGEIKNLNSFRFVGQAIEYEIKRQSALYEAGQPVLQETLHFDPAKGETKTLRSKEEAHDYRYFPQPDLPPVRLTSSFIEEIKRSQPETIDEAQKRLSELGLGTEQISLILDRRGALEYLDLALAEKVNPKRLTAIMVEFFLPACQKAEISPSESILKPTELARLASLMDDGSISRRAAGSIFPDLFTLGGDAKQIAQERGLIMVSDQSALTALATKVLAAHPEEVKKYQAGQEKILSFLVGQLMRESKGAADPKGAGQILATLMNHKGE